MSMYDNKAPYRIEVKAGSTHYICQCGATKTPPYCDGSHQALDHAGPLEFKAGTDATLYICGCGQSNNKPWCDGAHNA